MTYKVAIAISGAVSLGSYEAGTMYEIINAIKLHNETNPEDQHIKIDVMTGASAGGMTAAMVAQKLLYEADALKDPYTNAGYNAWVESVDIKVLLERHPGDNENTSLLSNGFVKSIADKLIMGRFQSSPPPPHKRHPAAADQIKLGLAMSNLNGVDYKRNIFTATHEGLADGDFIETRHQDRFSVTLDANSDERELWERISDAARCCGAFPFAFSPICFARKWTEPDYKDAGAEDFTGKFLNDLFSFTDGGAFNNYPLGMARNLVKTIDNDPLDYSKRYYFYISPNAKTSTMNTEFNADSETMIHKVAMQIGKSIYNQGRFQDWLMTDKINKEVALLDTRAKQLSDYLKNADFETKTALLATATKLCTKLYENPVPTTKDVGELDAIEKAKIENDESMEQALTRLKKQYAEDYEVLDEQGREAFLYSIALFEKAGNLNDRDIMHVYTITAKDEDLASEELVSFIGFMDVRFRHHDYLRGRLNGRTVINHIIDSAKKDKEGDRIHLPLNIPKLDTEKLKSELEELNLGWATMKNVDPLVRESVYERAKERFYRFSVNLGMRGIIKRVIAVIVFNCYIKESLRKYLHLNS